LIRNILFTTAPEVDEVETIKSLLASLKPGGLPNTESMAASIPILKFVSHLLEKEDVLETFPREIVVLFCKIAVKRLPLAVAQMKEPSFDSEFIFNTCELASRIESRGLKKGLIVTSYPLKDLESAMAVHLQPPGPPVWNEFENLIGILKVKIRNNFLEYLQF
jgi:hypothetical protein